MKKPVIGIIGNGFVGEAQAFAFASVSKIKIYDTDSLKSTHTLSETHDSDFIFVCVPTPMYSDGNQNLEFVHEVFKHANKKPIYILKSTVLPGTTKKLNKTYSQLKLVFSPEFLTERSSKIDMMTQNRIIIGGKDIWTNMVRKIYELRFKNKNIIETDSNTAELIKYMNNTFFATKVSVMNEFKQICDKIGADWNTALHGFASDGRIGDSHLNVPGHDGQLGYGGKCFPKDVNAFILYAKSLGTELNTIIGGWNTNLKVRKDRDWEK
ncbi:MAG: hypothetical protein CMC86_05440 [Flavobacteriaceae bacterium]|nr:hypothetical protein [Flavobacteriaceae bacterium]|tara:strand:- start:39683 stop:40483 length:801 start_codon:yes stop_codon:yes gene_type:complete